MRIRSVKFNFIMNFLLTASSIIFPLITFPYVSRVLQAAGNGKVAFATAVLTYFTMFASLGIPTYGIRVCAQVRDDREKLSRTVQELLIINTVTMVIVYAVFAVMVFLVPEFAKEKELLFINSITMVLNVFGVSWLYSALEQYAYITACSLTFKVISIVMMFAWVKNPGDYIIYGAITVFASAGSYVLNFINLHKYVTLKKKGPYNFKRHLKPIGIFFAMSAATSVYTNLDVVMIQFIKDETEVGYYNAAVKVKTILVSLITSLGTVLLPRLSFYVKQKEQDAFRKTIVKAFNFVLILASSVMLHDICPGDHFDIVGKRISSVYSADDIINANGSIYRSVKYYRHPDPHPSGKRKGSADFHYLRRGCGFCAESGIDRKIRSFGSCFRNAAG